MNDTSARVIDIISGYSKMNSAEISNETELDLIGINSLELTEVVMDLEDHYGIEIDLNAAEAWDSLKTVGDVVNTIEKLINSGS
ncbi:MAG TPA: acyl carrier protein [Afifellaceae bacterium]|nr:acyl carrier protein [Afifellaceae bacterium]